MEVRVKKSQLIRCFCAIALWLFSGSKVLFIGMQSYTKDTNSLLLVMCFIGALIFFSAIVFPKAIPPNVKYIYERQEVLAPYHCIRPKTWLLSLFMMSLGIGLRFSGLMSTEFISGFYSGLGLSLLGCSLYYIKPIMQFTNAIKQA